MPDAFESGAPNDCPVPMSDGLHCGRPRYKTSEVCLMHFTNVLTKDYDQFWEEVHAIRNGTSRYHRPKDRFDFTRFVFPETKFTDEKFFQTAIFRGANFAKGADFSDALFGQAADFSGAIFAGLGNFFRATFTKDGKFTRATFRQEARFAKAEFKHIGDFLHARFDGEANFYRAKFAGGAKFWLATFSVGAHFGQANFGENANFVLVTFDQDAYFNDVTFRDGADFSGTVFRQQTSFEEAVFGSPPQKGGIATPSSPIAIADFRNSHFDQRVQVRFFQINKDSPQGLRARFVNCNVEGVQFADVHWHREGPRMVLQDELDVRSGDSKDYELVAITYRQLVNNFEKVRAYDLAEDCFIGAMELKRLDPAHFLFSRWLRPQYDCWRWLRWMGSQLSIVNLYRLASNYGSSYGRAFWVLVVLLLAFAAIFALVWLEPLYIGTSTRPVTWNDIWRACKDGLFHSLEVATFQRQTLYANPSPLDRLIAMLENILVPAQLALLLLALRRRFRR